MSERLQKILSARGVISRRAAEVMINDGRIAVNGQTARLGDTADPEQDEILLDGAPLPPMPERVYIALYKPRGVVTTLSDEKGRRNVRSCLPPELGYLVPAGRLDLSSEGLIIMTNDGEAVNKLTHPSRGVEKEYLAWVNGLSDEALSLLTKPVEIDGKITRPARVYKVADNLLSITIFEGKNRQVRRICEGAGLHVTRLKRVAEGKIKLGELASGQWRHLSERELEYIKGL